MKRRWWIVPLDRRTARQAWSVCFTARYVWVRDARRAEDPVQVLGCVCHHSWTKRVQAFKVVPDA